MPLVKNALTGERFAAQVVPAVQGHRSGSNLVFGALHFHQRSTGEVSLTLGGFLGLAVIQHGPYASPLAVFFDGGAVYAVSGVVGQAQRDPV